MSSISNETLNDYITTSDVVNVKRLHQPVIDNIKNVIGLGNTFLVSPSVVHYSGYTLNNDHVLEVSVINISPKLHRLGILPPTTSDFRIEYDKSGSLAPGLSQKIKIIFKPKEYKYYHDVVRIQTEEQNILIPIHAYPVINKVNFPTVIAFGNSPLCEPVVKKVTLSCTIPVAFSYEIEVTQPHPYFKIYPLTGKIPAKGNIEVSIKFNPITLGLCTSTIRLKIGQYGFVPIDCVISAKAVSGLIESKKLIEAENAVVDHIVNIGNTINNFLGASSTFRGDLTVLEERNALKTTTTTTTKGFNSTKLLQATTQAKNHTSDPIATMLASTFRSADLNEALDSVIKGTELLGTKVLLGTEGVRGKHGVLQNTLPVVPKGPGSGSVFDAGTQFMINKQKQKMIALKKKLGLSDDAPLGKTGSVIPVVNEDRVFEGLRIPFTLDTAPAINFVITQEPGKLKPKDLKIAIGKNREEKALRAEEQKKIREEGGGAGLLDLRGILAEERLNLVDGDPFKRQLREMAFLADVDDVNKQEIEKGFRISEEYIGSNLLSANDIDLVMKQRERALLYKKRSNWRNTQSRQLSMIYEPSNNKVKAGAPADIAVKASETLKPCFDTNTNDIWAKRMNTLRRFITLVSRWLLRRRIETRYKLLKTIMNKNGVISRDLAKIWISSDNANYKSKGPAGGANNKKEDAYLASAKTASDIEKPQSAAMMVCVKPNEALVKRILTDRVVDTEKFVPSTEMARRVMFPKYINEEGASRSEIEAEHIDKVISFDDRTFFPLKVRPEYITLRYDTHKIPTVPTYFPPSLDKEYITGAPEELALRPPSDAKVTSKMLYENMRKLPEPPTISQLRVSKEAGPDTIDTFDFDECNLETPSWFADDAPWLAEEINYFIPRPDLRIYQPVPRGSCEVDDDWILRPYGTTLQYSLDDSIRTQLLQKPGFLSAHTYILGCYESRSKNDDPPHSGPTLVDFYMADVDRHRSGMNCFVNDHMRTLNEWDNDVALLRKDRDNKDNLSDSESDDEDGYQNERPSVELARQILHPNATPLTSPQKGLSSPGAMTLDSMAFSTLDESERKYDQVELLRDRKIMDMESTLRKERYNRMDNLTKKLCDISNSSNCVIQSLPIQMPYHTYEDKAYITTTDIIPSPPISFIETINRNNNNTMNNTMNNSMLLDTSF